MTRFARLPRLALLALLALTLQSGTVLNSYANEPSNDVPTEEVDLSQCTPTDTVKESLPIDIQKYLELANTCRNWGQSYTDHTVIDNIDEHASFTTTRCYTLQLKYNKLMNKYADQADLTNLVETCYVSF
jgi:hypothetical protein